MCDSGSPSGIPRTTSSTAERIVRPARAVSPTTCGRGPTSTTKPARCFATVTVTAREGKDGGTGFGLAIVQQVAEAHGGGVRYAREAGMSRFTVHLPAEGALSASARAKR